MITPAITVLMPVYNAECYLNEAIQSILNQTFTDFEFLIINDGCTDKSEEIILSYQDNRIRYIKNETNIKLIATLNKGIELARGKYIVRMDSDDISLPHRLQKQFDFMDCHSEVALCGSWFEMIGDRSGVCKYVANHNDIMMKLLYQCHFCHPSVIMRKEMITVFETKFNPQFIHAEDYDFFARIGRKFKLANIQEVLLNYRVHSLSVSAQNAKKQNENSLIIKKQLFRDIGVLANEKEIELYRTIAQHEYSLNKEYLEQSQLFLEKIHTGLPKSNYIEKSYLNICLSEMWFNITYNLTPLGCYSFKEYNKSILSKLKKLNSLQLLKFRIKALFKI